MAKHISKYTPSNRNLGQWCSTLAKATLILLLTLQPSLAYFGGGGSSGGSGGGGGGGGCNSSRGGESGGGSTGHEEVHQEPSQGHHGGQENGLAAMNAQGELSGNISQELYEDYSDVAVTIPTGTFTETINGESYIDQIIGSASNRHDIRLPGYSYFQGIIQSDNHITVAGQVRIVGGLLGTDREDATTNLYGGAMVTSNAHSFVGAGDSLKSPKGIRTRIKSLEEIPNP